MAQRMMMALSRHQSAWIFFEPVDPAGLNIPDYYEIVKCPMDFATIKTKLKESRYRTVAEFVVDLELYLASHKV